MMAGEDVLLDWLMSQANTKGGSKQTNNIQDLVSSLFSPEFGALTGSVDPLATQAAPYVPNVPLLTAYTNDPNADVRNAAMRIANGDSPLDVKMELRGKFGLKTEKDFTDSGLTIKELDGIVDDMYKEYASNLSDEAAYNAASAKALASNVFGDAMLPQPTERYTMDTMPVTSDLQAMLTRLQAEGKKVMEMGENVQGAADLEKQVMLKYAQENQTPAPKKIKPISNEDALKTIPLPTFKSYEDAVKYGDSIVPEGGRKFGDAWSLANNASIYFLKTKPNATEADRQAYVKDMWRKNLETTFPDLGKQMNINNPNKTDFNRFAVSDENKREDALMLDRAAKSEAKRTVGDDYSKKRKLLLKQAGIAQQKKAGELIALQMLGQTPLLDALKMRTTGLG
jgi:hypothetical protein